MLRRPLTIGEIELARSVFGDAIDYSKVNLVKGKWWPFHPRNAAMAPMGSIYFHPVAGVWLQDFSTEPLGRQGFLPHEMTYVWQTQTKGRFYLPPIRHPFCRSDSRFEAGTATSRYGIEHQAVIV